MNEAPMLVRELTIMPICEPVAFDEEPMSHNQTHTSPIHTVFDVNLKRARDESLSGN